MHAIRSSSMHQYLAAKYTSSVSAAVSIDNNAQHSQSGGSDENDVSPRLKVDYYDAAPASVSMPVSTR